MLLASTTCSISYQAVSSILYGVNVGDVVQGKFITPYPLFYFICGKYRTATFILSYNIYSLFEFSRQVYS